MIRVGPAGWSYADWEGVVYPRPRPRGFHPLPFLAEFFDCVEVNSSFYALPRRDHAARWAEHVASHQDFRFTAKLYAEFTHGPDLAPDAFDEARTAFLAGVEPLVRCGKFAALLVQFPISFRAGPRAVARLFEAFGELPLAVELRHREWFEPRWTGWMRERGVSLLTIDLPPAKEHPPEVFEATGPLGYLRLHGRNSATWFSRDAGRDDRYDYLYGPSEVEQLVARMQRLASEHDEVFVVTNNHFEGQAVVNGLELQAALRPGKVSSPPQLVERYPQLGRIARVRGQQRLF